MIDDLTVDTLLTAILIVDAAILFIWIGITIEWKRNNDD